MSKFACQKPAIQDPLFTDVELQTLKEMEAVCQQKRLSLSELVKKLSYLINE